MNAGSRREAAAPEQSPVTVAQLSSHTPRRRIVVTGVAGFIGSHLAEALIAEGHDVAGIDAFVDSYPREYKERNLRRLRGSPRFSLWELDLRRDDLRPPLEGADVVINEAAYAGLPRSWTDVEAFVGCNLLGLSRLVDACRELRIPRFLQASTSSVYGLDAVGDEERPTKPISPYGVSKLAAEMLLLAHVQANDFPAAILRYFSIYGPRQRPDMAYHIFIEAMRFGQPIVVYGDGRQSRSNTFISDCVDGTLAAIDGAMVGEVYNIGGGVPLELREAIEIIAGELETTPRVVYEPARAGDQRRTFADCSKARETFGYTPGIDPVTGLRAQVRWHLEELKRTA